jgi:ZIP family zinc transporter
MSFGETVGLGAIAGFTIFLGLPLARFERIGPRGRVALAMLSVGILAFLFVEVMEHGFAIVEEPWEAAGKGHPDWGEAIGYLLMFGVGLFGGLVGLTHAERRARKRAVPVPPIAGGSAETLSAGQAEALAQFEVDAARARALRTGLVVAAAIGLHNFSEGLAIGVSAKAGDIGLATVLIIGFALHNTTEGFGIVGPLGAVKPSWRWLLAAGLIGGGPTFVGTMVGYNVTAPALELAFYALAGGALLYVIGEIWNGVRRLGHRELAMYALFAGVMIGLLTELVVEYGGGG